MSTSSSIILPSEFDSELPTEIIGHASRRGDASTTIERKIGPGQFVVNGPWAVGCWCYLTAGSTLLRIGDNVDGNLSRGFLVSVRTSGGTLFYRGLGSEEVGGGITFPLNQWNRVGVRRLAAGASTVNLVLNGTQDASGAVVAGTNLNDGDILGWGGPGNTGAGWAKLTGFIAWCFALRVDPGSTAEVDWILRNPIAALWKYRGLISIWPMGVGPTASVETDISSTRLHLRTNGTPFFGSSVPQAPEYFWRASFDRELIYAPPSGVHGSLNKPLPLGIAATASVQVDGSLSKPIPFGRSIAASVQVDASLSKPIPFGRVIAGSVQVTASLTKPVPLGRSATASVQVTASLSKSIPIGRAITVSVGVSASVSKPIPLARSIIASVRVDASLNKPLPLGISATGSVGAAVFASLNRPIPLGRSIAASVEVRAVLSRLLPLGINASGHVAVLIPPLAGQPTWVVLAPSRTQVILAPSATEARVGPSLTAIAGMVGSTGTQ